MVGEIVFHLGDSKTGSTSIQQTLVAQAWTGASKTLLYNARVNHIPLAHTINRPKDKPFAKKRWTALRSDLERSDADIAVVSAEGFEFSDPDEFAEMVRQYLGEWQGRIRFITYLRPHAERVVSTYAERSKQGLFLGRLEEMHERLLDSGLLMYAPRIARWKAQWGDAYTVRPMIRSELRGGDVVEDFLNFVFHGDPVKPQAVAGANESLTAADLAALRAIHATFPKQARMRDAQKTLGWNLAQLISALPRPKNTEKPQLHRSLAETLVKAYRDDAAEVDRLYFEGSPLSKSLEAAPGKARETVQPIDAASYFGPDALRLIEGLGQLLVRMIAAAPDTMSTAMRPKQLRAKNWDPDGKRKAKGAVAKKKSGKRKAGEVTQTPSTGVVAQVARRLPKGLRRKLSPLRRHLS
ncbi:hypothetical protein [Limimaricola hongkongensis]|uniref:Uncharacterized protein n=1 Tax=Limimaricola hongkongensis DSM 17492 TaxID=1122180 RepID=A0A017H9Y5_9RHOB|nr:hypothetical protein [Limimaricola hongkongensis]EYD70564.1 hypothetical protein Lokhon_02198 [Limimaricola hongkongensis DSM 17492]